MSSNCKQQSKNNWQVSKIGFWHFSLFVCWESTAQHSYIKPDFSLCSFIFQSGNHPLPKTAVSTEPQLIGWHMNVSLHVSLHLSQPHHPQTDALVAPWEVNFRKRSRLDCFQQSDESPLIFIPNVWVQHRLVILDCCLDIQPSTSIIRLGCSFPPLLNLVLL